MRWLARFMVARSLHLRPVGRLLASACMAVLYEAGMPAAAVLQPVGFRQVAPVFPAVTLRWLHGTGERALRTTDFGV